MSTGEVLVAIVIYLIVPLLGMGTYLLLVKRMLREDITNPPIIELFVIFAIYGAVLLIALTSLFWVWSGAASLGTLFLVFGAPIVMGFIAYRTRKRKNKSRYHQWTYALGWSYLVFLPFFLFTLYLIV